jgi:hypothetical protein
MEKKKKNPKFLLEPQILWEKKSLITMVYMSSITAVSQPRPYHSLGHITALSSITAWARVNQNPPIMHHEGWMESEQGTIFSFLFQFLLVLLPTY